MQNRCQLRRIATGSCLVAALVLSISCSGGGVDHRLQPIPMGRFYRVKRQDLMFQRRFPRFPQVLGLAQSHPMVLAA